jgi:hypothetical protein
MGKFIQSHSSSFSSDGEVTINGVSYKDKYPGYRFYSISSDCNVLTEIDGERQIIEVYGERYIITTEDEDDNFHRHFTQDTVAVLKNEDAKLYWKLQWLNYNNFAYKIFLYVYIGIALLIIHFGASFFLITSDHTFNGLLLKMGKGLFYSIPLVVSELFLFVYGSRVLRLFKGFISVLTHVLKGKEKLSYYKKLFEKLSKANCRDKAKAAKLMHKILFFC